MGKLTLNLTKSGDEPKKLSLNLSKASLFSVELYWDSKHDLDAHALLATNNGQGAKVSALEQVLSTFNESLPLADGSSSTRRSGDKRPFKTPDGALHHSGDARDGQKKDIDEIITIDGAKIPSGVNEIPIFVTIYPRISAKFSEVEKAGIRIKDDGGRVLGEFELSREFGEFNAVQMGSMLLGKNGWEYAPVGVGFNGDFDSILGCFS